jgi:hypothetical protein
MTPDRPPSEPLLTNFARQRATNERRVELDDGAWPAHRPRMRLTSRDHADRNSRSR